MIVAHVRGRLARQISDSHTGPSGYIPLVTLSAEWELAFAESLVGPPEDRQLAMAPSKLGEFMQRLRASFDAAQAIGEMPVLLASGGIPRASAGRGGAYPPVHPGARPSGNFSRGPASARWGRSDHASAT